MKARGVVGWVVGAVVVAGVAACSSPRAAERPEVTVPLAEPVYVQALRYTELFEEKPFAEAVLIYMRNGSYKILSPGEDHYGSYVSARDVAAGPEEVAFMSWPATDWADNVAWHTLTFDKESGAFRQVLRLPGDVVAKQQAGIAAPVDVGRVRLDAGWDVLRAELDETFEELAQRAERRE